MVRSPGSLDVPALLSTTVVSCRWVDSVFMGLASFSIVGNITMEARYADKMYALFHDMAERRGLWSGDDGLFYRDESYFTKVTNACC